MSLLTTGIAPFGLPLIYLTASAATFFCLKPRHAWRVAELAGSLAVLAMLINMAAIIAENSFFSASTDVLGLLMSSLISLIGWVIIRYSKRYLNGEPGQIRYTAAMLLTLAAVSVVASTDNLGVLIAAWILSSLSLHHLLLFYRERPSAVIVAHKKFIASRLAEICLLSALVLIYHCFGNLNLSVISEQIKSMQHLPTALHVAMVLIAMAAILKSALLPIHGWLIQVMEAPTPVSALLHAGIVNLGGFVLIRMAVFLSAVPAAQIVLGVVGSLSAILAGLVMMTRISIKVRLAWSTCAQMGFMLLECSLGLYELAFLHLIAHSAYKAHAFLTAGETVMAARRYDLLPTLAQRSPAAELARCLIAAPVALLIVALCLVAGQTLVGAIHVPALEILIVGLGLAPMFWRNQQGYQGVARALLVVTLLSSLFVVWHWIFSKLIHAPATHTPIALHVWVGACFVCLYFLQVWLRVFPRGRVSRTLYPWVYAGFFLDERFNRFAFHIWPAKHPQPSAQTRSTHNGVLS